jgi:hypothetical protein
MPAPPPRRFVAHQDASRSSRAGDVRMSGPGLHDVSDQAGGRVQNDNQCRRLPAQWAAPPQTPSGRNRAAAHMSASAPGGRPPFGDVEIGRSVCFRIVRLPPLAKIVRFPNT